MSYERERTHLHVLPEQPLLLLQDLLDTLWRQLALLHDRRILRAVHEAIDVMLKLDHRLEQLPERPSRVPLRRSRQYLVNVVAFLRLGKVVQPLIELLDPGRGLHDRSEERILRVLKEVVSHLTGGSEPGRSDGYDVQEEHVGEGDVRG